MLVDTHRPPLREAIDPLSDAMRRCCAVDGGEHCEIDNVAGSVGLVFFDTAHGFDYNLLYIQQPTESRIMEPRVGNIEMAYSIELIEKANLYP